MGTSKDIAFLFPGQGSQSVGMLNELAARTDIVANHYQRASQVLGYDLWELVQQGPTEKLNQTEFTQPALLVADVVVWQCWQKHNGPEPTILAGHSLGEYSALVCANALQFNDAVALVAKRGCYMQQAVPTGAGAMAAIIGLDKEKVAKLCEDAAEGEVLSPANFNSVGQIVIAGHTAAVDRAVQLATTVGAKVAMVIPVSAPSHCELMQPAADQLATDLASVEFGKPTIPVVQNADVQSFNDPEQIRATLIKQLTSPVRWVETIQLMIKQGMQHFIECGPGKVLVGLNKRIDKSIESYTINTPEKLQEAVTKLANDVVET